jgi:hypothetical protein
MHKNYRNKGRVKQVKDLGLPLSAMEYGELGTDGTFILLQWLQCTYYFSKFTKDVFSMQGLWLSSNTLPTMVHGQPPSKDHPDPKAGDALDISVS